MNPSILSIDPGGTTGWAFITEHRVETGIITRNTPANRFPQNHVRNALVSLRVKYKPDVTVVERMPMRLQPWLRQIVEDCENIFPQRHLIGPGEWKPVSGKVPTPLHGVTVHERDAYRMGIFYLHKFWGWGLE